MNERIKAGSDIHAGDGGYGIGTKENYDAFVKVRNKSLAAARIRRLAEQARMYALTLENRVDDCNDVFEQKFAELIVRECADVAADHDALDIYEEIREHFGVEE
jgi:hypothetical protein